MITRAIRRLRRYFLKLKRARRDARDLQIINANADRLNAEAADALEYQATIWNRSEPG